MEEPCPPDNIEAIAEVRRKSSVPISAGERVYSIYGFDALFSAGAVDIAQPDIFHAGGILESKKIAAMAEAKHIPVSFHNPSGPVSNAAILQLAATVPNFLIHEIMLTDGKFRRNISNEEVVYDDGFIMIGDRPGIGIEINEDVLRSTLTSREICGITRETSPQSAPPMTAYIISRGLRNTMTDT